MTHQPNDPAAELNAAAMAANSDIHRLRTTIKELDAYEHALAARRLLHYLQTALTACHDTLATTESRLYNTNKPTHLQKKKALEDAALQLLATLREIPGLRHNTDDTLYAVIRDALQHFLTYN